jgi:hypothetical protein
MISYVFPSKFFANCFADQRSPEMFFGRRPERDYSEM